MPLLLPSPHLTQVIFSFLNTSESSSSASAHSLLADALHSWAGQRLQQRHGGSFSEPLPPIPFSLIKQLHSVVGSGSAAGLWRLTKGCALCLQSPNQPLPHPELIQVPDLLLLILPPLSL
jgi:hypothetical protein